MLDLLLYEVPLEALSIWICGTKSFFACSCLSSTVPALRLREGEPSISYAITAGLSFWLPHMEGSVA